MTSTLGLAADDIVIPSTIDPILGLKDLPLLLETPQPLQTCQTPGGELVGSFIRTGRGGLTPAPYEPLSNPDIWEDLQPPAEMTVPTSQPSKISSTPASNPSDRLAVAQGWVVNDRSDVELVAFMPRDLNKRGCPISQTTGDR